MSPPRVQAEDSHDDVLEEGAEEVSSSDEYKPGTSGAKGKGKGKRKAPAVAVAAQGRRGRGRPPGKKRGKVVEDLSGEDEVCAAHFCCCTVVRFVVCRGFCNFCVLEGVGAPGGLADGMHLRLRLQFWAAKAS